MCTRETEGIGQASIADRIETSPVTKISNVGERHALHHASLVRTRKPAAVSAPLALDEKVKIQVWDSVSEIRYLVLPERPVGTEAMTEEELAAIVTRDSMIGVSRL